MMGELVFISPVQISAMHLSTELCLPAVQIAVFVSLLKLCLIRHICNVGSRNLRTDLTHLLEIFRPPMALSNGENYC